MRPHRPTDASPQGQMRAHGKERLAEQVTRARSLARSTTRQPKKKKSRQDCQRSGQAPCVPPGLKASTVPRRRSESVSNCAVWLSIGGCHVLRKASLTRCDQQESDWRFARRQRMCLASRGTPNLTLSAAPFRRASTSCTKPPSSPQGSRFEWQKRKSVSCRWNRRAQ